MSPTDRCDEVIRLIDSVLDDDVEAGAADDAGRDEQTVESVPGHWGVYYLRPSA